MRIRSFVSRILLAAVVVACASGTPVQITSGAALTTALTDPGHRSDIDRAIAALPGKQAS